MSDEANENNGNAEERESEFAPAWMPNPGDVLTARMLNVDIIDPGQRNQPYPVLLMETAAGEQWSVHANRDVLKNEIARCRPKVGDELTITYKGKKPGGKRDFYHSYKVTGGQAQEVNWDDWLPPSERGGVQQAIPETPPMAQAEIDQIRAMQKAQAQAAKAQAAEDQFGGDSDLPF